MTFRFYSGECRNGPMAGKILVHTGATFTLLRPALKLDWPGLRDPEIEAVPLGEYVHMHDQWMWRPA